MHSTKFAPAEMAPMETINAQAAMIEKDTGFPLSFDAVGEIVIVINAQRQIVFANRRLADMLGVADRRELYGKRPGQVLNCINAQPPSTGCGTTEFCTQCGAVQAIVNANLLNECELRECHLLQADGSAMDLRVRTTPLELEGEHFVIAAAVDVSHEQRRHALERIFFHDLLNSVTSVSMSAQMMKLAPEDDHAAHIDGIYFGTERMVDAIRAQRELLAAEDRDLAVQPRPLSSGDFLTQLLQTCRDRATFPGRQIKLANTAADTVFHSDPTLLARVLQNMIKNAIEACPEGQTVTVGCDTDGETIAFWVHNPGFIPHDIQLKMFQRSVSSRGPGRGLGTYSIKLLTERYLHGQVDFTSTEDNGTRFTVRYPISLPEG